MKRTTKLRKLTFEGRRVPRIIIYLQLFAYAPCVFRFAHSAASATPVKDPRDEVEDGERFLRDYLRGQKWKDPTASTADYEGEDSEEEVRRQRESRTQQSLECAFGICLSLYTELVASRLIFVVG